MTGPRVVIDDGDFALPGEIVEFRLTYEGQLIPEKNKGSPEQRGLRATQKQAIRKVFHRQLKRLWETSPILVPEPEDHNFFLVTREPKEHKPAELAVRFPMGPYNFVPLITRDIDVAVSLDVLFLREDGPGPVLASGDIDNRLKTLFDALSKPTDMLQLGEYQQPAEGETPFFCLMEDDSLISRVSVETDGLLEPVSNPRQPRDARVVITVKTKLLRVTVDNLMFA